MPSTCSWLAKPKPIGIIHGFGFASQLQVLGIPKRHLVIGLTSFNLGIELAQLLLAVPLLIANHLWGPTKKYQNYVVQPTALAIAAIACFWIAERGGFIGPWVT